MLVTMKRELFDSLEDAVLAKACIEPILQRAHENRSAAKVEVLAQLTPGQRVLFMFRALYDHAGNSAADLYFWVSHLLSEARTWSAIKGSLRYLGDEAMLQLLEEMEGVLEGRKGRRDGQSGDILPWDLESDPELFASISRFHAIFYDIAPATFRLMGAYIRSHPHDFVVIEE